MLVIAEAMFKHELWLTRVPSILFNLNHWQLPAHKAASAFALSTKRMSDGVFTNHLTKAQHTRPALGHVIQMRSRESELMQARPSPKGSLLSDS